VGFPGGGLTRLFLLLLHALHVPPGLLQVVFLDCGPRGVLSGGVIGPCRIRP